MIDDEVLAGNAQLDAHVQCSSAERAVLIGALDVDAAIQDTAGKMLELRRFGPDQVVQHGRGRDIAIEYLRSDGHRVSLRARTPLLYHRPAKRFDRWPVSGRAAVLGIVGA